MTSEWVARIATIIMGAVVLYPLFCIAVFATKKDELGKDARGCIFSQLAFYATVFVVALPFVIYNRCQQKRIDPLVGTPGPVTVYICTGPYAERYHLSTDCHGLQQCGWDIDSVPLDTAKYYGYTLCGFCRSSMK